MESFETTAPIIVLVCSLTALLFSFIKFYSVKRKSEGTDMMKSISVKIRKGAMAYLKRQYKTVGKRKVLAWTVQSKNAFGDVPLTKYVLSGTPFDLRGYYMGQFRDKSSHVMMAEYRQMINTDKSTWIKKMLNHIGYVAWGGCGFMGPTPGKIEGVLPNLGVGLRIEVQPRMNVRLDLGRDMVNKQNLFYFNMTEAF